MTTEFYWLTLTALMTALFWMPYVLNRMAVRGMMAAMGNAGPDAKPHAPWAERAMGAHRNAIENLAVFAPLVVVANVVTGSTALTAGAAAVYFLARLAHFILHTLGIPVLRTLAFCTGWVCQMVFALVILGIL